MNRSDPLPFPPAPAASPNRAGPLSNVRGPAVASGQAFLRRDADPIERLRLMLERRLAQHVGPVRDAHDRVAQAMQDAVLSPGRRMRPLLLLVVARALRMDPQGMLDVACAVEIVHAASLVLDDLPCMDDARLRRGRPTIHVRHGEDVAVLAAIAQVSLAFGLVAEARDMTPAVRNRMVAALASAIGLRGLVDGQLRDLRARMDSTTLDDAQATTHLKTGVLFGVAMELAALAADVPPATHDALQHCARHLGQAFQLVDDLKDTGALPAGGKDVGVDAGKPNLLALLQPAPARQRLAQHLREVERQLGQLFPEDDLPRTLVRRMFG